MYSLSETSPTEDYSIIGLVVGNVIVMFIEAALVCIQSLRLEFYELFGRFYTGRGIALPACLCGLLGAGRAPPDRLSKPTTYKIVEVFNMITTVILAAIAALAVIVAPAGTDQPPRQGWQERKEAALRQHCRVLPRMFAACGCVFLGQGVAAANDAAEIAATTGAGTDWTQAFGLPGARPWPLASPASPLRIAVSNSACAAIGALTENEGTFGKSIVFVGLAEGIAIYGLLVAIVILLF